MRRRRWPRWPFVVLGLLLLFTPEGHTTLSALAAVATWDRLDDVLILAGLGLLTISLARRSRRFIDRRRLPHRARARSGPARAEHLGEFEATLTDIRRLPEASPRRHRRIGGSR